MKFFNLSFPIFLASTLATSTADFSWNTCGSEDDLFQVSEVVLSPDPPKSGESAKITVKGKLSKPIEDGSYAQTTVKVGLIKLYTETIDICGSFLDGTGISCPIPAGDLSITKSYQFPAVPPAVFTADFYAYNDDDADITCLKFKLDTTKHLELRK